MPAHVVRVNRVVNTCSVCRASSECVPARSDKIGADRRAKRNPFVRARSIPRFYGPTSAGSPREACGMCSPLLACSHVLSIPFVTRRTRIPHVVPESMTALRSSGGKALVCTFATSRVSGAPSRTPTSRELVSAVIICETVAISASTRYGTFYLSTLRVSAQRRDTTVQYTHTLVPHTHIYTIYIYTHIYGTQPNARCRSTRALDRKWRAL